MASVNRKRPVPLLSFEIAHLKKLMIFELYPFDATPDLINLIGLPSTSLNSNFFWIGSIAAKHPEINQFWAAAKSGAIADLVKYNEIEEPGYYAILAVRATQQELFVFKIGAGPAAPSLFARTSISEPVDISPKPSRQPPIDIPQVKWSDMLKRMI